MCNKLIIILFEYSGARKYLNRQSQLLKTTPARLAFDLVGANHLRLRELDKCENDEKLIWIHIFFIIILETFIRPGLRPDHDGTGLHSLKKDELILETINGEMSISSSMTGKWLAHIAKRMMTTSKKFYNQCAYFKMNGQTQSPFFFSYTASHQTHRKSV